MRCRLLVAAAMLSALAMSACKSEKKPDNIIVKKHVVKPKKTVQDMGDSHAEHRVEWLGSTYRVLIDRKADKSLSLAADGQGNRYYDNRVTVVITRPDGSEFLNRTFTKANFADLLDGGSANGALLGVVFVRAEGDKLILAASVGSPDRMSDEYVPLVLTVSRTGGVDVAKDTQMDGDDL